MNNTIQLSKKFSVSLIWNIAESLFYHITFAVHHCYAYVYTEPYVYGQSGTYFSLIYCAIALFSSGFEESLSFSYKTITDSKYQFNQLLIKPIVTQAIWATLFFAITIPVLKCYLQVPILQLSNGMFVIILLIIIVEIIRKSLRRFLHISFCNQTTTISEIILIGTYVLFVWGWYLHAKVFTISHLLTPMLIASLISTTLLIVKSSHLYHMLPRKTTKGNYTTRIKKQRIYNYGSQFVHQIFSGNILIPLIAAYYGFNKAGVLELVRNIIYVVSILLNKVLGPSVEALLAHKVKEEHAHYQTIFYYARKACSLLIWCGTFLTLGLFFSQTDVFNVRLSVAVFVLYLLEHVSIFYERLLRVQGHAHLIFKFNMATFAAALALLPCITTSAAYTYIGFLSVIKAIHVFALRLTTQRKDYSWNIAWIKRFNGLFKKSIQKSS
ncbi:MAG: hypothetical protein ACOYT8_05250 [Candidatus Dependentiae bacterium]